MSELVLDNWIQSKSSEGKGKKLKVDYAESQSFAKDIYLVAWRGVGSATFLPNASRRIIDDADHLLKEYSARPRSHNTSRQFLISSHSFERVTKKSESVDYQNSSGRVISSLLATIEPETINRVWVETEKLLSEETASQLATVLRTAIGHINISDSVPLIRPSSLSDLRFLDQVRRLANTGEIDAALDILYDKMDRLLVNREFSVADAAMSSVDIESFPIDISLGLLTITLPAAAKLPSRKLFFQELKQQLRAGGEDAERILVGLSG